MRGDGWKAVRGDEAPVRPQVEYEEVANHDDGRVEKWHERTRADDARRDQKWMDTFGLVDPYLRPKNS
eukprot:13455117-Alexandrium_andersonii.AAC.1